MWRYSTIASISAIHTLRYNARIRIQALEYFTDEGYASLDADNKELLRMLAAIVKTSKGKEE